MCSKAIRKLLKSSCTDISTLSVTELHKLQFDLHQEIPSLGTFFNWCTGSYGTEAPFSVGIAKFISDISCNTPTCAIFPPDPELRVVCTNILSGVSVKEYPDDMEVLQRSCPLLFGFLSSIDKSFAPQELNPLLT